MKEDNEELSLEYDEDNAIAFIQNFLPQDLKEKFSSDELNYIIDLIYEFYEDKGFFDETNDEVDVEIDEDELIAFVIKQAQKDKVGKFTPEEITFIVQGELAYCDSLDIFD